MCLKSWMHKLAPLCSNQEWVGVCVCVWCCFAAIWERKNVSAEELPQVTAVWSAANPGFFRRSNITRSLGRSWVKHPTKLGVGPNGGFLILEVSS